jgi:tRNA pseudouridine13 synthase
LQPTLKTSWQNLPYAWGGPNGSGILRAKLTDFRVTEIPITEPTGTGEHSWLYIRKTGANTEWVARQLAIHAAVPVRNLSYAGLKDRNAITEQWFSVHLPGKPEPNWSTVDIEGVEILHTARHTRKLKRGALKGNRFDISITSLTGESAEIENRLIAIKQGGVPNYFGAQRFGRDGQNLFHAEQMFKGELRKIPRHKRGLYLSAARSSLFNQVLAERVADDSWFHIIPGDVLQLDGRSACFVAEEDDSALLKRIESMAVHLTGPMWGCGELMTLDAARNYEITKLEVNHHFREGLERAGLKQERRSLRIQANQLAWQWLQDDSLRVQFSLPPGAFATSVLRELCLSEPIS